VAASAQQCNDQGTGTTGRCRTLHRASPRPPTPGGGWLAPARGRWRLPGA